MPPLTDRTVAPIQGPSLTPRAHPGHPSPTRDGLLLEVLSVREVGYHGRRFAIDTPYWIVPLGWGEWAPLVDSG